MASKISDFRKNPNLFGSPNTTLKYSGNITTVIVGEAVSFGDLLYIKSDGKAYKTLASSATTMPCTFISVGSFLIGSTATVLIPGGILRNDSWAWTPGSILYVSPTTSGGITDTVPSSSLFQIQSVAVAIKSNVISFIPILSMELQ